MNTFKIFLIFIFAFSLDSHIYTMKNENNGSENQDLENGINLYEWLEEEAPQLYVDEKSNALLNECSNKMPLSKTVEELLSNKADVNKKFAKTDKTPLHLICQVSPRSLEVLKVLIKNKADVNAQDYLKESPLYELCKKQGCFDSIKVLIKNNADVNIKNSKGDTPFHIICKNPKINIDLINLFIKNGACLNNQGRWKNTPLHVVCNKKNPSIKIVKALVENKAHLNIQGKQENTPLHRVCRQDFPSIDTIKVLIENGANPNSRNNTESTPLHLLCTQPVPSIDVIKIFVENGANLNSKNNTGRTHLALVCQASNPSIDAIKTLLEYKAEPNAKDDEGSRLLHSICSATNLSSQMIQLLIENKANPNIRNEYGNTAFHLICRRNDISFIIAFISSIIDVRCENFIQVMEHLCKINPLFQTEILSCLCALKQLEKKIKMKIPKVIKFEIFKWMILGLLDFFINIKNSENQTPLEFAQATLGSHSNAVVFLNGLQEAIVQGYEAVIQFLRNAAEFHKK